MAFTPLRNSRLNVPLLKVQRAQPALFLFLSLCCTAERDGDEQTAVFPMSTDSVPSSLSTLSLSLSLSLSQLSRSFIAGGCTRACRKFATKCRFFSKALHDIPHTTTIAAHIRRVVTSVLLSVPVRRNWSFHHHDQQRAEYG